MIQSLKLRNLKCFEELDLRLAPLTLLTGFNAAGKSSALQALLLVAQTLRTHSRSGELQLNGPLVSLGTPGEILHEHSSRNRLELGLSLQDQELEWSFSLENDHARRYLRADKMVIKTSSTSQSFPASELRGLLPALQNGEFQIRCEEVEDLIYLAAGRQTNLDVFPIPETLLAPGDPGCTGQYAPWQFYRYGDEELDPKRCMPGSESGTVRKELNNWLDAIFPGAQANALQVSKTDLIKLEFRTTEAGEWKRPSNVGFGLSYAFPMLIAGLCSRSEQTIIVDSPEAHLHPRGQSIAGRYVARLANGGQQFILETHSDHFLNGVRLAVKEGLLRPEDVAVYFFRRQAESRVTELSIDSEGNLNSWPEGFFDQAEQGFGRFGWLDISMEWHFNDLSLHGQYRDPSAVRTAFTEILELRRRRLDLAGVLFCSKGLSQRPATATLNLREAVSSIDDRNFQSALLRWLGKAGPFWEDTKVQNVEDLFYFGDEDVTYQGLGEAARRRLVQMPSESFSLSSPDQRFNEIALEVTHGLIEAPIENVNVPNIRGVSELATRRTVDVVSWNSMIEVASTKSYLVLSERIGDQLKPKPFHKNLAERVLLLLDILNKMAEATNSDGGLTEVGLELHAKYFVGKNAWFSSEYPEDEKVFTFPNPDGPGNLYCPWHGKTKQGDQTRIHFEWPRPDKQRKVKVVYIGTKITKW
jgi:predicted ATPase